MLAHGTGDIWFKDCVLGRRGMWHVACTVSDSLNTGIRAIDVRTWYFTLLCLIIEGSKGGSMVRKLLRAGFLPLRSHWIRTADLFA